MGLLRGSGQFLLLTGVIGLTLVSVSSPLIPRIAFLKGHFDNNISLLLGMSGGCVIVGESQTCPAARIGYSITLDNFPGRAKEGPEPISSMLSYTLIMFPIAGILALLAFFFSLPKRNRLAHHTSVTLIGLSFVSSAAALIISLLLFIRAMQRINDQFSPASPASLGVAIWIAIASVLLVAFSGMFIASSGPGANTKGKEADYLSREGSNDRYMRSKDDLFHKDYPTDTYTQSYGNYTKPVISEPQYIPQGMNIEIENPNEGYYYESDVNSMKGVEDDGHYHARTTSSSSYYDEAMKRRQPSLRRSISRNSNRSNRSKR